MQVFGKLFSNKQFDVLKWIAMIVFPALGTLYSTLAGIWGLPFGEQICATFMALQLFLGALLGISHLEYKKMMSEDVGEEE